MTDNTEGSKQTQNDRQSIKTSSPSANASFPPKEDLLKEYEVAQQFANNTHNRQWQITGILLIIAIGSPLGVYFLEKGNISMPLLIAIAVLASVINLFWFVSWMRENFYLLTTYFRLREIEIMCNLRRNQYINAIDKNINLSNLVQKGDVNELKDIKRPCYGLKARYVMCFLTFLIFAFWIYAILSYCIDQIPGFFSKWKG